MGRKFFYIVTVLLFSLSTASADEEKQPFPMKGGTTSDGIIVSEPLMNGFQSTEDNRLNVVKKNMKADVIFDIIVPDGKEAALEYSVLIKLLKPNKGFRVINPKIFFDSKHDGQLGRHYEANSKIDFTSEVIPLRAGKNTITLEASFKADGCIMSGGIKSIYIHVHKFSDPVIVREPICGVPGKSTSKCVICGFGRSSQIPPKYQTHSLITSGTTKTSCLSNMGSLSICEQCPYSEIERKDSIANHDFDDDDRCRVCKLRKPKSNAQHSVYEIHEASEMRVLAELVSLGTVPGNIGIDIKNDLVFSRDTTMLPLGTFEHPFQGVLNGNGHRIKGITNCFQGVDCLGFIGVAKGTLLSHAVIANLVFDADNSMKGTGCVGGIVGYATCCDIINCASFGALEGANYVGSIVGYADQYVSFQNCASVSSIRTQGNWNPMACGLPFGRILNSYGAATNSLGGAVYELETTMFRNCYTTLGSDDGLTLVSPDVMSSYNMVEMLNQQSESPSFVMTQNDAYPMPVVNTTIQAMPNPDISTTWAAIPRRAPLADVTDGEDDRGGKGKEIEIIGGYEDKTALEALGMTLEEVVKKDSVQYDEFDRTYIAIRSVVDESFEMFEPMSGGTLINFESYMLSPDSTYLRTTGYYVSDDRVKPVTETIDDWSGAYEQIDEYNILDGTRRHMSHTIIEDEDDITYQENINGVMKTVWTIKTVYDESGEPVASEVYSHNQTTGEVRLEYRYDYSSPTSSQGGGEDNTFVEYTDEATNPVHYLFNNLDAATGAVVSREHYIISADGQYLLEIRSEKMIDGQPYLTDGMYFVYNNEGELEQSVAYGPEDTSQPGTDMKAYLYFEYLGIWKSDPYPTAIQVPTVTKPSMDNKKDYNIYDMHGRVVRRATNLHDPFSGLPNGLYVYQGNKYLKRN